jgi:hypothetical protein
MDANMSLQHALDHEKVDHLMQNNINAKLDNGTDADRNDIAHLGSEEQSQHQEEEHHELESELVNFDQNLEEAAMNHGREQEGDTSMGMGIWRETSTSSTGIRSMHHIMLGRTF